MKESGRDRILAFLQQSSVSGVDVFNRSPGVPAAQQRNRDAAHRGILHPKTRFVLVSW